MDEAIITTSWDDGHPADIQLANLLDQYNLPATFYLPIENQEGRETMDEDEIREISQLFEIGGHTYSHTDLTTLPKNKAKKEIQEGKEELEGITGQDIKMFCYPKGKHTPRIQDLVRDAGFIGARTVQQLRFNVTENPYALPTTVDVSGNLESHLRHGYRPLIRHPLSTTHRFMTCLSLDGLKPKLNIEKLCQKLLQAIQHKGGVLHLWGHSWEIEKQDRWDRVEKIFKLLSNYTEITYVSNTELVQRFYK